MEKQYRLPKEFAEQWVAALRSGEFKQGEERLLIDGAYCCLGVGGKICGYKDGGLIGRTYLSTRLTRVPRELVGGYQNDLVRILSRMNDGLSFAEGVECRKYTFPEIADWIEANVEFYPTPIEIIGSPIELS